MKVHDAIEQAYKNGYEAGKRDARKKGRWIRHGCYGTNTGKRLWEWTCSECQTLGSPQWKCCPVCTAMMDGDGNG